MCELKINDSMWEIFDGTYKSLLEICNMAKINPEDLTEIRISKNIKSIGEDSPNVFWRCRNLISIIVDEDNENYCSQDGVLFNKDKTKIIRCPVRKNGKYTIPNGVTCIFNNAFNNCRELTHIEIPNTVTAIEDSAFLSCMGLTSVVIPDSVTDIGDGAFDTCLNIKSIKIGKGVINIGDQAFCDCKSLTSLIIGDNVTEIGAAAFEYCTSLESVVIPNKVTHVGERAFSYCRNLKLAIIPHSIRRLGREVFEYCDKSLILKIDRNSYTKRYAEKNDITYELY